MIKMSYLNIQFVRKKLDLLETTGMKPLTDFLSSFGGNFYYYLIHLSIISVIYETPKIYIYIFKYFLSF